MAWHRGSKWALVLLMLAASAFFGIADSAFFNRLIYGMLENQYNAFDIGMFLLEVQLCLIAMAFAWGLLSDIAGRRIVLAIGLSGTGLAAIAGSVADSISAQQIMFIVLEVFSVSIITAALSYVGEVTGPAARSGVIALVFAAWGTGGIFGQIIKEQTIRLVPWSIAIPGIAIMLLVVPVYFFIAKTGHAPGTSDPQSPVSPRQSSTSPRWLAIVALIAVTALLFSVGVGIYQNIAPGYIYDLIKSDIAGIDELFPYILLLYNISAVVFQALLVRPAVRHFGDTGTIAGGLLLASAGIAIIAMPGSPWTVMAGICLAGAGTGLVIPCLYSLVSRQVSPRWQGMAMGAMTSVKSLGIVTSTIVGAILISVFEDHPLISIMIMFVAAVPVVFLAWYTMGGRKPMTGQDSH